MTSLGSGVKWVMNKTYFKRLDLKKLRKKFDYEKFYNCLTNKIKAADGKFYNPSGVIVTLQQNVGISDEEIYENYFSSPRCVLDKNFPEISIEDGSLFTFFNKNIECETLFAAKKTFFIQLKGWLHSLSYYFLLTFKDRDKKVLTHMYHNPDYGWEMDVEEIFDKRVKNSDINKKILNKIFKENFENFQFMFFSKSFKINVKKLVQTFQKKLKPIFPNNKLSPNLIRNLDMYIYEIYPNIKIPFLSNIDTNSVPDFFYNTKKISKNIIELKTFTKGKIRRLLGRKVEIKKTKKFKVKPLFVHRYLKDDWKSIKGKSTGSIFFR